MPYKDPVARATYLRDFKRRNRHRYVERQRALDSAKHANERAARYGCDGVLTIDEAAELFKAGQCHYCGSANLLGLDHVEPLHDGGLNRPENIVVACRSCNSSKWRGDAPWRWARDHEKCVDCGTTDRKHIAHGMCTRCHRRDRALRENPHRRAA